MRLSYAPWLVVSVLIHLGVLALAFLAPRPAQPQADLFASAMPVTIVSKLPVSAPVLAPEPQPDAAPPVEEAVDTPEPPQPAPPPPKVSPTPAPNPTKVVKPTPPAPPKKGPPGKSFNLDDFISDTPAKPAKKTNPGPPRPAAAPTLGPVSFDASELGGLASKVARFWDLNCDIAGTRTAVVEVNIIVNSDGRLSRDPQVLNPSSNPAVLGPQRQAVVALKRAQPFSLQEVPPKLRNREIPMEFRAADVCRKR